MSNDIKLITKLDANYHTIMASKANVEYDNTFDMYIVFIKLFKHNILVVDVRIVRTHLFGICRDFVCFTFI